jgi:transposase
MLIGRCAWHVLYHGRPRWEGVASWQGWTVRFTDGICPRCLERFREEHQAVLDRRLARRPRATDRAAGPSPDDVSAEPEVTPRA